MLVAKVTCPRCGKRLKTSSPLAAGYRVLCSGCNSSFAVRPEDTAPVGEPPALPPAPGPTPPPATRPTPDTRRAAEAAPALPLPAAPSEEDPRPVSPWLAVLGLGALVGGVLLLAGGIALAMHLSGKRD